MALLPPPGGSIAAETRCPYLLATTKLFSPPQILTCELDLRALLILSAPEISEINCPEMTLADYKGCSEVGSGVEQEFGDKD